MIFQIFAALLLAQSTLDREPPCKIAGLVLDSKGVPVEGVQIHLNPVEGALARIKTISLSDRSGGFAFPNVNPGVYRVHAGAPDKGYADSISAFQDTGFSPLVEVTRLKPFASATVILGPKNGIVTGTVTDATTGLALSATVHLWRIGRPEAWIRTSVTSPYRLLIPADIPVGIEVTSPGYQMWRYFGPGGGNESSALKLESGAEFALKITLLPNGHQ